MTNLVYGFDRPLLGAEFKSAVRAYLQCDDKVFRKSILSIRDGGGVIEQVLYKEPYKTVLEIGTYRGIGAAFIAQFVDRVITIDLSVGKLEQTGEARSWNREKFWHGLGLTNIEFWAVANDEHKATIINNVGFDLAFIDGGKNDIAKDFELVKHCGAVLFHDYDCRGRPELDAVYNFVNSLSKDEVEVMDIFALWKSKRGC